MARYFTAATAVTHIKSLLQRYELREQLQGHGIGSDSGSLAIIKTLSSQASWSALLRTYTLMTDHRLSAIPQ